MVYCINSSNLTSKNIHTKRKDVLSKLINRAERRKSKAETFLVYALLQSTVERLRVDVHLLDSSTRRLNRSSVNQRIKDRVVTNSTLIPGRPDGDIEQDANERDPLQLDLFFNKLKRCFDNRDSVS